MACFDPKTFLQHDDYMTPKSAWEDIQHIIPRNKILWEAFYGNGDSGRFLTELGFNVLHDENDFFTSNQGDIIISNPPFSQIPMILKRLLVLGKPFILIMPSSKINTQYFRKLFSAVKDPIQIIIPKKRIHFAKIVNGEIPDGYKSVCNFDCFYYCWKMDLKRDIVWLE